MPSKLPLALCLLAISLSLGACTGGGDSGPLQGVEVRRETPAGTVARFDETRHFAAPVEVENLTVWPILAEKYVAVGEFLTLGRALEEGQATIRESGALGNIGDILSSVGGVGAGCGV